MMRTPNIDPQAQLLLEQMKAQALDVPKPNHPLSEEERVKQTRAFYRGIVNLGGDPEAVASVEDILIQGASGSLPLRIYRPRTEAGPQPALLWFHGGGFVSGDLETHDRPLRSLANQLGFPVIAVAWRLAPEYPYPAAIEDAFAALMWASGTGASQLSSDPRRIAVGGDSAGGAIAAVLTHIARQRNGPAISFQVLIYPNTDLSGDGSAYPSWRENDGLILNRREMEQNCRLYAGSADPTIPTISPLLSSDFRGLPPAFVVTGEADPQRDEGEAYVTKLQKGGVAVHHKRYPGMIHGFFQMGGVLNAGRTVIGEAAEQIKAAFKERD